MGDCFSSNPDQERHLTQEVVEQQARDDELSREVAVRPEKPTYSALFSSVQQMMAGQASHGHVMQLWTELTHLRSSDLAASDVNSVEQSLMTWQRSIQQFCMQLQSRHPLYADVYQPFLAALCEVRH